MISAPKVMSGRRRSASSAKRIASSRRCRRFIRFRIRSSPCCKDRCRCGIRRGSVAMACIRFVVHLDGIDRTDPQARQIGHQPQDTHDQIAQLGGGRQIGAPAGQVDTGQHHLVIARIHQPLDLIHHHACRNRAGIAAPKGNDAEGAAMIAAVLHLHIGARPRAETVDQVAGGFRHGHDVIDLHPLGLADEIGRQARPCLGLHLFGIADDQIDLGHGGESLGLGLRGAAGHDQPRVGVFAAQAADFLPGLAHGLGGHGAGVDDRPRRSARLAPPVLSSPRSHRRSAGSRAW